MSFMHLLFPRTCLGCGDPVLTDVPFCDDCMPGFCELLYEECPNCGQTPMNCKCLGDDRFLFFYRTELSKSIIHDFKHFGNHCAYTFLGNMIYNRLKYEKKFDCVLYPLRSAENIFRYGFDQMKATSDVVAELFGIPSLGALKRIRKSKEQKLLSADQRTENVKNLFEADADILKRMKRVLLLDDVRTTGSTLRACRKALRAVGIKEIVSFAVCKTPKKGSARAVKSINGNSVKYKRKTG